MAIKRFNYTGRQRIERSDVTIVVYQEGGRLRFVATVALGKYDLPAQAHVFLEAYRQTSFMRFDFGTVAACSPHDGCVLSSFDVPDGLLFRVKVTSVGDRTGVLLAEADQIPFRTSEEELSNRISLLPVCPQDLGPVAWQLDFKDGRPLLLVNSTIPNCKQLVRSDAFVSLALPAIVADVLRRILLEDLHDTEEGDDWRSHWLRFATSLPGVGAPPEDLDDGDAVDEWVESAMRAFAARHQLLERLDRHCTEAQA